MFPAIWTGIFHTLPLHEAFRVLKAGGWTAFEISTEHLAAIETAADSGALADQALRAIAELKICVPQAHAHLAANVASPDAAVRDNDIRLLRAHMALAARLGVKTVVIHPGKGEGITSRAERARSRACNVEVFRRLGDEAAAAGMRIGLENMMRRGFASPHEMLDLLEAIDHPAVAFTLDTSHAHAAGFNLPEYVKEMGTRLIATHISDNDGSVDQHRVPGSGTIAWGPFMAALRETGYDGLFNLEIPGERHAEPGIQALKLEHARRVAEWLVG
jgi:D-psicose/D-tagatose/L-ribulose 3-epimerase